MVMLLPTLLPCVVNKFDWLTWDVNLEMETGLLHNAVQCFKTKSKRWNSQLHSFVQNNVFLRHIQFSPHKQFVVSSSKTRLNQFGTGQMLTDWWKDQYLTTFWILAYNLPKSVKMDQSEAIKQPSWTYKNYHPRGNPRHNVTRFSWFVSIFEWYYDTVIILFGFESYIHAS